LHADQGVDQVGWGRLVFKPRQDGLKTAFGCHQAQADMADISSTRRTNPSISTQCESKMSVGQILQIDVSGCRQIGQAQDFNFRAQNLRRKTARTGASRQFDPLAGLDIFLSWVQVHINRVPSVLQKTVAPGGIGVGDDAAQANSQLLGRLFGAQFQDVRKPASERAGSRATLESGAGVEEASRFCVGGRATSK